MNTVEMKIFPVNSGDCFLVRIEGNKITNILIDCGYKNTTEPLLKELKKLNSAGESLRLLVITHIDNDHIGGAIKLLEENQNDEIIKIEEIWFNGFKQIYDIDSDFEKPEYASKVILESIIGANIIKESCAVKRDKGKDIGYNEAYSFEKLLVSRKYNINSVKNGKSIYFPLKCILSEENQIEIILLSPTIDELNALKTDWENYLRINCFTSEKRNLHQMAEAFELYQLKSDNCKPNYGYNVGSNVDEELDIDILASRECKLDTKQQNLSSLAFILKIGEKRILFLGDSSPLVISKTLSNLQNEKEDFKSIDLIKMAHHGSKQNINNEMLSLVKSNKFLISTDGTHGHPNKETIAKIICRENSEDTDIYFNYPSDCYSSQIVKVVDRSKSKDKIVSTHYGDGKSPLLIYV